MSKCVVFRVRGDERTYVVDLGASLVSAIDCKTSDLAAGEEGRDELDFAVVRETRAAPASYPLFADR